MWVSYLLIASTSSNGSEGQGVQGTVLAKTYGLSDGRHVPAVGEAAWLSARETNMNFTVRLYVDFRPHTST